MSTKDSSCNSSHLMKLKIEELQLQKSPDEWQKEQEYSFRRNRRKQLEKQIQEGLSRSRLKQVRFLFIPAGLGILSGTIMLFGSTVRSIGEGSVFWTHRPYFSVIGPVVLVIGLICFFVAEGLTHHLTQQLRKSGIFEIKHDIHLDFLVTNKQQCPGEYSPDLNQHSENSQLLSTTEESFLCSSISSTSTLPDFAARWVHAMNFNFQNESAKTEPLVSPESDKSNESFVNRALNNAQKTDSTSVNISSNASVQINGSLIKSANCTPNGNHKALIRREKVDNHTINGKNGPLLGIESLKVCQRFRLEGISEESSKEIIIQNC